MVNTYLPDVKVFCNGGSKSEVVHRLNLADHGKPSHLLIKAEIALVRDRTICARLHI